MSRADLQGAAAPPVQPGPPEASVPHWQPICGIEDIPRLGARRVERAGFAPVAVFRTADDAVFALVDRCPHRRGPLSQGIVFGRRVACPLHNWSIGLEDGCAAAPDSGCTPRVAVRQVEGVVQLDLTHFEPVGLAGDAAPPAPCTPDPGHAGA